MDLRNKQIRKLQLFEFCSFVTLYFHVFNNFVSLAIFINYGKAWNCSFSLQYKELAWFFNFIFWVAAPLVILMRCTINQIIMTAAIPVVFNRGFWTLWTGFCTSCTGVCEWDGYQTHFMRNGYSIASYTVISYFKGHSLLLVSKCMFAWELEAVKQVNNKALLE